jgi:hypothetical protein
LVTTVILAAHRQPVLGARRVGDDAPFLDAFDAERRAGERGGAAAEHVRHDRAVEHVAVRPERRAVAAVPAAGERPAGRHVLLFDDADLEERQVDVIADVERQFGDRLGVDERAERSARRVHERRFGRHRDRFGERADLQRQVDDGLLRHRQRDAVAHRGAEAVERRTHLVAADRQRGQPIRAVVARERGSREARIAVGGRERRAGNDGAGGVTHGAEDCAGRELRERGGRTPEAHENDEYR